MQCTICICLYILTFKCVQNLQMFPNFADTRIICAQNMVQCEYGCLVSSVFATIISEQLNGKSIFLTLFLTQLNYKCFSITIYVVLQTRYGSSCERNKCVPSGKLSFCSITVCPIGFPDNYWNFTCTSLRKPKMQQ